MKKILLLAAAGLLAVQASFAQDVPKGPAPARTVPAKTAPAATMPEAKGNGKISGAVLDGLTREPVAYASVALTNKATGKIVDGTITDSKGKFSIQGVANADYRISISFLGYETSTVDNVSIAAGKEEVQLGVVTLQAAAKALNEVSVVGEKALIEDKVDRIVYNAEKDIQTGGTAADVMRKVPGLSVDLEGELQLRGSSNIRVLINNKPSAVMASSVADALQQIPADQIKSVEVITSPSAKYDAEGTAGIINIITKKNDSGLQGFTGSIFAGVGTINSNTTGTLNYRKGKVGLNSSLGYNYGNMRGENSVRALYGPGSAISSLAQEMEGRRKGAAAFLQLGADYELSKKSYLAAGVRLTRPDFALQTTQVSTASFADGTGSTNTRSGSNEIEAINYDINLDYTRSFAKPGQELSVLGLLSRSSRELGTFMSLYTGEEVTQRERNLNDAYNDEMTLQTDYTHPVSKTQQLEVGAKAIWRYAESDYRFLLASPAAAEFVLQPNRTDVFEYHQDVLSSYATYSLKLDKNLNLKLGGRYEYTDVQGDFISSEMQVRQNYHNFFPSLSVSKNLQKNQSVKFNYSRRILRPQLSYLNPYENLSNPLNVQRGNPNLEAELTDSYEVGYSTFSKSGITLNTSLYWYQTNNAIQQISTPYSGTNPDSVGRVTNTVGNIGRNSNYGLSLSGSAKFLEKGRINANFNTFYTNVRSSSQNLSNYGLMYMTNLNVAYNFEKGYSVQLAGDYVSPQITLQGTRTSMVTYNFAARKEVLNKKGSFSLGLNNPFHKTINQERFIKTYNAENVLILDQENTWRFYRRQVRVSFNYQFGKQDAKAKPRRVKKVSNDDAKEDEGAGAQ